MNQGLDAKQPLIQIVQQLLIESGTEYTHRKITLDASLSRHLGLDSLGRAELFQRIEKHFAIQLPDTLMAEADTLQDVLKAIYSASHPTQYIHKKMIAPELSITQTDPSQAETLIDVLLLYANATPDRPHIYLEDEKGNEEIITYGQLLEKSLHISAAIQSYGLKPGETVAIMQPTNPGFFYTFYGALIAGCIPVPIYPPFRAQQIEAYAKLEANILKNAEARLLVTFYEAENISKLLRGFIPSLRAVTTVNDLLKTKEKSPIFAATPDDFALIQYTSGSTNIPKGVLLAHKNLLANIRAYGQAIRMKQSDVTVSWVPLYHDMGLIGMWMGSLYHGIPLTLLSPLTFLNRPERWLWAIHYHRGTLSGGPNFAYELCVRKIEPEKIEGLDLSSWRVAANGAEAIQAKTIDRFAEKFAPYGFKKEAFLPAYGLAESTVCVSVPSVDTIPRVDIIDRQAFEIRNIAEPITEKINEKNSLEFVSCGKPIPDHEVRIVDKKNTVMPERQIGFLQFKGPSSMQGYFSNPKATQAIYHDGWWDSGDMGYLADGEIFITGREKDIIIKAGRNLYPTELEEITASIPGVRKGCVTAFGITDPEQGTEKLIVIAETSEKNPRTRKEMKHKILEKINNVMDIAPDQVILVEPHTIPKTSSGKLQRSACKKMYLEHNLKKKRLSVTLQLMKLSLNYIFIKLLHSFKIIGKIFYTIYIAFAALLTVLPLWLIIRFLPQPLAAKACKKAAKLICLLSFCPIKIIGQKKLFSEKNVIFTANHTSYTDAILLLAILPTNTLFVGKQEFQHSIFIGTFMKKLGYIFVNRFDFPKGIEDTQHIKKVLHAGSSILIFPEGTFSYAAGLRPFKLGAFKIAAETDTSICPIAILGARKILRSNEFLFTPARITITICDPIKPIGKDWQSVTDLRNKTRTKIASHCGEPTLDFII